MANDRKKTNGNKISPGNERRGSYCNIGYKIFLFFLLNEHRVDLGGYFMKFNSTYGQKNRCIGSFHGNWT